MKVLLLGAGLQAKAAAYDLCKQDDVTLLTIVSADAEELETLSAYLNAPEVATQAADVTDPKAMAKLMAQHDLALSMVPYTFNAHLATWAVENHCHFLDLGGNNNIVAQELALDSKAKAADVLVLPDCGLAPGLVSILAKGLVEALDTTDEIHLRVGGLPRHPKPPLDYAHFFSINGLINEYVEPVEVIQNGKRCTVQPLSDFETLSFDPPFEKMEAFTTSGGTSTLCQTYEGKVRQLDYKTIRYPGHGQKIRTLFDLGLTSSTPDTPLTVSPREVLTARLEALLEKEKNDVVLLKAWGKGTQNGMEKTISYNLTDDYDKDTDLTAMMRTTAFTTTVLALAILRGVIPERGATTLEHIAPVDYVINQLGKRGVHIIQS